MAATLSDIKSWFDKGLAIEATHMLVCCAGAGWNDCCYPVFVLPTEDVHEKEAEQSAKVEEVYLLDPARRAEQLVPGSRVRNYE